MEKIEEKIINEVDLLIKRYPILNKCKQDIINGYLIMKDSYEHGGKLLIAGNGGSAADCAHIAGELMKGFKLPRRIG